MAKKWLFFSGKENNLTVIEEKGKDWGKITEKKTELTKSEGADAWKLTLTYELTGIWLDEKKQKDNKFTQIEIPGGGLMLDSPSTPQLPQEGIFVAIPENAEDITISVVDSKSKQYHLNELIIPVPVPTRDLPQEVFKGDVYNNDGFYPGSLFKNLGPRKMGEITTLQIMILPVQYNPKSNIIELYSRIQIQIDYKTVKPRYRGSPTDSSQPVRKRVPRGIQDSILNLDNI